MVVSPGPHRVHLDSAAVGRPTPATIEATVAHLQLEVELGGYEAEAAAMSVLTALRTDLAGLLGVPDEGIALLDSGTTALATLLEVWPLPDAAKVAVAPSEWGPNLHALDRAGLTVRLLPVDAAGRIDLEALDADLAADRPDLVHLVHAASHRGLVQPVAEVAAVAHHHGVPVWVDAAQSLGQLPVDALGADAAYAVGRKWLRGPRGVGVLAVATEHWAHLRGRAQEDRWPGRPVMHTLEPGDASVAARVGVAHAVAWLLAEGPETVSARLAAVAVATRARLAELPDWAVVDAAPYAAIVGLAPTGGQDVARVRQRLLDEHDVLTTACLSWRAPHEGGRPTLRFSGHVDTTPEDLDRAAAALRSLG